VQCLFITLVQWYLNHSSNNNYMRKILLRSFWKFKLSPFLTLNSNFKFAQFQGSQTHSKMKNTEYSQLQTIFNYTLLGQLFQELLSHFESVHTLIVVLVEVTKSLTLVFWLVENHRSGSTQKIHQ
jgi:hypothetical protein